MHANEGSSFRNQVHLNGERNSRATIMGHAYWGLHMIWGLNAPLRYTGHVGIDFALGRMLTTERRGCRGLGGMCANAQCGDADVVRRPWHASSLAPPYEAMPGPRAEPTFKFGGAQTAASCSEGYYYCADNSRFCAEELATWEPMEHVRARKAWMSCTTSICTRVGASPYDKRCAGAMLTAWTSVWRHMPPPFQSDSNRSRELVLAGYYRRTAFGPYNPDHAAAALASLSRQAQALFLGPPDATRALGSARDVGASCRAAVAAVVPRGSLADGPEGAVGAERAGRMSPSGGGKGGGGQHGGGKGSGAALVHAAMG